MSVDEEEPMRKLWVLETFMAILAALTLGAIFLFGCSGKGGGHTSGIPVVEDPAPTFADGEIVSCRDWWGQLPEKTFMLNRANRKGLCIYCGQCLYRCPDKATPLPDPEPGD
jgi:hypothetical protein